MAEVVEAQTTGQTQENKAAAAASNSDMLQLVTEAVKKVLADKVTVTEKFPENIVSQVVEELKPTLASSSTGPMRSTIPNIVGKHIAVPTPITKPVTCVYNPTPIAELKKRHIPVVSYMPTRETRIAVKRKCSPERAKTWLSIIPESSSSQQSEITYKPTAIVNTTDQDTVPGYVPTFKSDSSSTSNSYDDGNSNDYQSKFKEAYYPKSKKRREEYVPKMVKTPLKTTQQLDNVTGQFESEFDIDEIFTSSHAIPKILGQAKVLSSEDSQDYSLYVEPKFSDDELAEKISKDEDSANIKKTERFADVNKKKKENLQHLQIDEQVNDKDNKIYNNHYDAKTSDTKSSDTFKQYKENNVNKSSNKKKEDTKKDIKKEKETHKSRSHSKSKKKDKKDHRSSEKRDRDKSEHKSDSRGKHSSSSKDKDRRRSSRDSKESSHKNKEHSRRDRRSSPKKDRDDHHKSTRHEKHRSKTSSSSSKSSKSDKKRRSESSRRSSTSRKSSKYKESSSERNSFEGSDDSPLNNTHPFADDEPVEISDSDHDVQEECLKIFQVNNLHIFINACKL